MFDFRDVGEDRKIDGYADYFENANYPAQLLNAETKIFFDNFFSGEGFITLCDLIFGPYYDRSFTGDYELCWLDYANIAPTQTIASSLSRLIRPESAFISTLEALSLPSPAFAARLRKGWKNAAEASLASFLSTDLPLSAIYPQSYQLMGEPGDANLYALPRSRVPPVLLVPFWEPPVVTRKELSQHQILTSLPCNPLGYFIFRLLFFGMRHTQRNCIDYLVSQRPGNILSQFSRAREWTCSFFRKPVPSDMPYYAQLLQSYVQVYVSPALPRHLGSKPSIVDISWTAKDAAAALLAMAPSLLAHRQVLPTLDENTRYGCTNREALAQLLSIVPLHTSLVYAMYQQSNEASSWDAQGFPPPDFPVDSVSKAQSDIEHISGTLYRNCLTVLRECLLSFELEPYCRAIHFTYCLELWAVLMNPFHREQRSITALHVVRHFEVFGFIIVDVLNMLIKSSFVSSMNGESAQVLKKCFQLMSQDPVTSLMSDINASQSSLRNVVETVSRHFVLNWTGSDGTIQIPNLHGKTTCDLAARVYVSLERLLSGDVSNEMRDDLRETLSFMTQVFPGITSSLDAWRSTQKTSTKWSKPSAAVPVAAAQQLSESEKLTYFRGGKARQKVYAKTILLPTRNGRIPGSQHPSLHTSLRNEVPVLLGVSRFLDACLGKILEFYFWSWIPTCDRGHGLWLLYSKSYSCCNHPCEQAIWECSLCEALYGSCCKGFPYRADGERLMTFDNVKGEEHQCSKCGEVVPPDGNVFCPEHSDGTFFCPDCASRPFTAPSTRWVASYTAWAALLIAFVCLCFVALLSA